VVVGKGGEGGRVTKFVLAHLNQMWHVLSLHPRDGHGGLKG